MTTSTTTVRMAGAIQGRREARAGAHVRTTTRTAKRGQRHSARLEIRDELAELGMRIR